jgi:hypothetical protein
VCVHLPVLEKQILQGKSHFFKISVVLPAHFLRAAACVVMSLALSNELCPPLYSSGRSATTTLFLPQMNQSKLSNFHFHHYF